MKALLFALIVAAGACAPVNEPSASDAESLPAPTPADVAVRIDAAQAGQVVEVGVNQRFAVELVGVPTAGYVWAPAQLPAFLTRAGEASGPTISAQEDEGYSGGNHWEVLLFAATAPGEGELVLVQHRPWESAAEAVDSFRVTIRAR